MRIFMCRPIICFTADIITKAQDPACTDCVNNEGLCYDSTLDKKYDGCVCPASRSGQNCSDIHGKTHIKHCMISLCRNITRHSYNDANQTLNFTTP